ncbi:helix-turn-helix transcriptional regulator [Streptomyces collinus]|uniref:helix-turn-helix transcriptional regulator n=1 Tax=Streptomyces collinus TaxID=42684 RepID=UPI0038209E53
MDLTGYLTSDEAAERLGINRQSLYNLANRSPDFPKPKKIGRTSLWPKGQLDAWRAQHPKRQTTKK